MQILNKAQISKKFLIKTDIIITLIRKQFSKQKLSFIILGNIIFSIKRSSFCSKIH